MAHLNFHGVRGKLMMGIVALLLAAMPLLGLPLAARAGGLTLGQFNCGRDGWRQHHGDRDQQEEGRHFGVFGGGGGERVTRSVMAKDDGHGTTYVQ